MASSTEQNYAWVLFDIIKDVFDHATTNAKKDGQEVKIECATDFGTVWVTHLTVDERADLLRMEVLHDDGTRSAILTAAARCSFKFSKYTPSSTQKETMGFGIRKTTA